MSELESAWTILMDEPHPRIGWYSRRILPGSACIVRAGLHLPAATRGLLIEVSAAAVPASVDWPECVGFITGPEVITPGPGGDVLIFVEERSPLWRELFGVMATEVVRHIARAASPADAVRVLLARLAAWQRFMSEHGPGALSDEACVGLVAELLFLEEKVLPVLPVSEALDAWLGPSRGPQDFRFEGGLVEVKGSILAAPASIRVANLEQLSGVSGLPLLLCHVSMSLGGTGARTLPQVVEALRARAAAASQSCGMRLEDLLFQAGYFDIHAPAYRAPAYALRALRCFAVTDGFPRLTPETVPAGVLSGTYSVSLAACAPFEVSAAGSAAIIGTTHV